MILIRLLVLFLFFGLAGCASNDPPIISAKKIVEEAIETLAQFNRHQDLKHYKDYLNGAAGVLIFPEIIKVGWMAGAEVGHGVLLVRQSPSGWSDPTFKTLAAASIGLQMGIQDTAVILIVRNKGALKSILKHQGKIGADVGATVIFRGVGAEASTTSNLGADIVAFAAPNIGAYLGTSLEGSILVTRRDLNEALYGAGATPNAIISGNFKTNIAEPLKDALGP